MIRQGLPGAYLEGPRLEEWCHRASSDPRDWYTPEERYVAIAACNRKIQEAQRLRNPRYRPEIYLVEGDTGTGKSAVCTYWNVLWALQHGAEFVHNGMVGPGRHMEGGQLEWITALDSITPGTLLWLDEAASIIRHGRDSADIQEFFNQSATGIRKKNAKMGLSSAMDYRIGSVVRGSADKFWLPQKVPLYLNRKTRERMRKQMPRGAALAGKHDPSNFSYRLLTTAEKPMRPASMFDPVTGRKDRPLRYFEQALSVRWMQTVMPLLDTFQSVPLGSGLTANREDLLGYLSGKNRPTGGAEPPGPLRPADVLYAVYAAFQSGDLHIPQRETHLRSTELLYVLRQYRPDLRLELLTYTLKSLGLEETRKGWSQVAVLAGMFQAFDSGRVAPPDDWEVSDAA